MSTDEEHNSKNTAYSESETQRMILYYCLQVLMIKRYNAGKDFGKTFMQKAIQKMQEAHIPKLEKYFYTVDRIACSFSPGLQSDYDKLQSSGCFQNPQLLNEIKNELNAIYGEHLLKKVDEVAESIKDAKVNDLMIQSDKREAEEIRRTGLFYMNPEAAYVLGLRNLEPENEVKEKWLSNLGAQAHIPTANPISIRKGNIRGIVKATGFFVIKDYLMNSKTQGGRIIALFGDSRQDINQSCLCLIDKEITIQALTQYENELPEGKFLVIGRVVPNPCSEEIQIRDNSETVSAKFALEALAILQSVVGIHTVITSSDKCAQEIKHYAKKDSYEVSLKTSSMIGQFKKIAPRIMLATIRDFCRNEIKDSKIHPPEHLQSPIETLTTKKGDCKAKVCLAYSMLIAQNFIERAELVFFNVVLGDNGCANENAKPNHVQLEVRLTGDATPILLELTQIDGASYREVSRVALPLYTI